MATLQPVTDAGNGTYQTEWLGENNEVFDCRTWLVSETENTLQDEIDRLTTFKTNIENEIAARQSELTAINALRN